MRDSHRSSQPVSFTVDGILYINGDHPLAAEFKVDRPELPVINQIAFARLLELTETNRGLRAMVREHADAYQRGYTQAMADAAARATEAGSQAADGK